jgi:hypothetical protein
MSRSKRLFKLIQKSMPDLVLCKDLLVIPPTDHVVRGFLVEATSQKERIYLWRVVTPLLRPMENIIMTYSHRISGNKPELYIRKEAFEESADNIRIIISEHIEYLRTIRHPDDFLRHASWVVDGSPLPARLDQALMHYVIGNVQQSIEALRALDKEVVGWDARRKEYVAPLLKRLVREIDIDPLRLTGILAEWEQQNIERLGLDASRPSSDQPPSGISVH